MSLSVQECSVIESSNFNSKHVRSVYVKDVDQCLVSKDLYEATGFEKEDEAKAIQRLVPEKYKTRFGDAQIDFEGVDNSLHTQPNTCLFFLRDEASHSWIGLWKPLYHKSFEN